MNNLTNKIKILIEKKHEGIYWDFKEKWHKNNANLIRDILSLANVIDYKGDRYLIIGVTDQPEYKIVDKINPEKRKTQSDLLDIFSNLSFQGGYTPDISLKTINFDKKELDIIVIKDKPFKPYSLQKRYNNEKENIYPGTIYSRVGDKNTSKDSSADLYHTEKMWRERFGLDATPLERIQLYLQHPKEWKNDGISNGYHKQFPEFTIEESYEDSNVEARWWSMFLGTKTTSNTIRFKYHTTNLKEMIVCNFRQEDIRIPYPDVDYIKIDNSLYADGENTYCLFSFMQNTFSFSLLYYLYGEYKENSELMLKKNAISSPTKPPIKHLPFIVFKNNNDKNEFINYLEQNIECLFLDKNIDPKFKPNELLLENEKTFAYWAYEKYHNEWKIKK